MLLRVLPDVASTYILRPCKSTCNHNLLVIQWSYVVIHLTAKQIRIHVYTDMYIVLKLYFVFILSYVYHVYGY